MFVEVSSFQSKNKIKIKIRSNKHTVRLVDPLPKKKRLITMNLVPRSLVLLSYAGHVCVCVSCFSLFCLQLYCSVKVIIMCVAAFEGRYEVKLLGTRTDIN